MPEQKVKYQPQLPDFALNFKPQVNSIDSLVDLADEIVGQLSHHLRLIPPVNIMGVAGQIGIVEVMEIVTGVREWYGATYPIANTPYCSVELATNLLPAEKRFVLGHEIGHVINLNSTLPIDPGHRGETFYDIFSRSLLLPKDWLISQLTPLTDFNLLENVVYLVESTQESPLTVCRRLEDLNLLWSDILIVLPFGQDRTDFRNGSFISSQWKLADNYNSSKQNLLFNSLKKQLEPYAEMNQPFPRTISIDRYYATLKNPENSWWEVYETKTDSCIFGTKPIRFGIVKFTFGEKVAEVRDIKLFNMLPSDHDLHVKKCPNN